jgi:hypothetical protein
MSSLRVKDAPTLLVNTGTTPVVAVSAVPVEAELIRFPEEELIATVHEPRPRRG